VRVFTVLTQASLSPKTVRLILYISDLLRSQKDFFTMSRIYEEFLLPKVIAGVLKLSTVAKEELCEFVNMYVEGFNENISISS